MGDGGAVVVGDAQVLQDAKEHVELGHTVSYGSTESPYVGLFQGKRGTNKDAQAVLEPERT